MKRQVIQIIGDSGVRIYALCDDGTIWWTTPFSEEWHQMKDVPQPVPLSAEQVVERRKRSEERLEELRRKWEGEERSNVEPS